MTDLPHLQSKPVARAIRVGLSQCHSSVSQLVCRILEGPHYEVVSMPRIQGGLSGSGLDLLICDLSCDSIKMARKLDCPTVFMLTESPTFPQLLALISLKCYALVEMERPGELTLACESLLRGRKFVSSYNALRMLQQAARPAPVISLEPVERQVLEALRQSSDMHRIADHLNSSLEDATRLTRQLYGKLGVTTRRRALRRARTLHLFEGQKEK